MEKISRKSNFELLRICCIFGIICMHTLGPLRGKMNFINGEIALLLNSAFNAGVTIFVLISGYFSIKFKEQKMIKIWLMVLFYSLISFGIEAYYSNSFSIKDFIKSCIPLISKKYWFISCYFVLCFLSPFLNKMFDKFEKETNRKLIIILLIFFSIIPTFFLIELTADEGKGIINMILIYLIGRYISYYNVKINNKFLIFILTGSVFATFILMSIISKIKGIITLGYFFRDNSITIIIVAVCIFMLFKSLDIQNKLINNIAKNVLAIYIFESIVRKYLLNNFIDLTIWANTMQFYFIICIYCIITIIVCVILEKIRTIFFDKLENFFADKFLRKKEDIINKCYNIIAKMKNRGEV